MIDNPTKQKEQSDVTVRQKQGDLTTTKQKSRQGGASEIAAFVQRTQALQAATRTATRSPDIRPRCDR